MKKILKIFTAVALVCAAVPARADVAAVGYLHDRIKNRWGIDLPVDADRRSNLVSMRYLMIIVDKSNRTINGEPGTNYAADPERATSNLASTKTAYSAVENLIKPEFKFFFTPATDENTYTFQISAAGIFIVDWADGNVQVIPKNNTTLTAYSHTYDDGRPASAHEIKLAGRATKYSINAANAAISFYNGSSSNNIYGLKSMRGCLGCVFPTITNESVASNVRQPRFYQTFAYNKALTSEIPAGLFSNVHGAPVSNMFRGTFYGCTLLSGAIPGDLFSGLKGAAGSYMFFRTFSGCHNLTEIQDNLFAGISGPPASYMFSNTFYGCKGLSGEIPENLFGDISGPAASNMFSYTFYGCSGLTGPSARVGAPGEKEYLYERWPDTCVAENSGSDACYKNTKNLEDWANIPTNWGGPMAYDGPSCGVDDADPLINEN